METTTRSFIAALAMPAAAQAESFATALAIGGELPAGGELAILVAVVGGVVALVGISK